MLDKLHNLNTGKVIDLSKTNDFFQGKDSAVSQGAGQVDHTGGGGRDHEHQGDGSQLGVGHVADQVGCEEGGFCVGEGGRQKRLQQGGDVEGSHSGIGTQGDEVQQTGGVGKGQRGGGGHQHVSGRKVKQAGRRRKVWLNSVFTENYQS